MTTTIRFDNGDHYERYMGAWSRLAGDAFLDWLPAKTPQPWLDVGCGSGAFGTLLAERGLVQSLHGIDPSAEQIQYAQQHLGHLGEFQVGDAMALPYADQTFDATAMALVIFFVPNPAQGVAEMRRVTRPGGLVSAYAWDLPGGGFPYAAVHDALRDIGVEPVQAPSAAIAQLDSLAALWRNAGLVKVDTCTINVTRQFHDFDSFWDIVRHGPGTTASTNKLTDAQKARLKDRTRERLTVNDAGVITITARANAVYGRVPT